VIASNDPATAIKYFTEVIQSREDDIQAHIYLANLHYDTAKFEEAREINKKLRDKKEAYGILALGNETNTMLRKSDPELVRDIVTHNHRYTKTDM
jgi:hypothetical protein